MSELDDSTNLSGRRRRLGASRETMAAGLGLPIDALKMIESGGGTASQTADYDAWLSRIESWPADKRSREFLAAGKGQLFDDARAN